MHVLLLYLFVNQNNIHKHKSSCHIPKIYKESFVRNLRRHMNEEFIEIYKGGCVCLSDEDLVQHSEAVHPAGGQLAVGHLVSVHS